jgi:AraC-like DNA-binding protein
MRPKPPSRRRGGAGNLQAAERLPRPVTALADSFVAGCVIPAHFHRRAQLIYALRGTMAVRAAGALWALPPSHALWVPPRLVHEVRMQGAVEMRTLYVQAAPAQRLGRECRVLLVSPLLRELIVRATDMPALYDVRGSEGRLVRLILDEIAALPELPLRLPLPSDARLLRVCSAALADLSKRQPIARLGAAAGLSERSVIRRFPKETGLSFGQWRKQARLLKALELIEDTRNVMRTALEVGYSSPAAFTKMFRRAMGRTPSALLRPPA